MDWTIGISALMVAIIVIVPIGLKWELEKKVILPGALVIGMVTYIAISGIMQVQNVNFSHMVVVEFTIVTAISISLLLWRFHRDPERVPPVRGNAILSPADGRVIYVKQIEAGTIPYAQKKGRTIPLADFAQSGVLSGEGYLIGISMNYLDVHVNRAPISGEVSLLKHIRGQFISLKKEGAVFQNERMLTVIDNGQFRVGIMQIASRLVRRIVTYLRQGDEIGIGERIGMIRFGSQVDMVLPNIGSIEITVVVGQKVKAGISVVARFDGVAENKKFVEQVL